MIFYKLSMLYNKFLYEEKYYIICDILRQERKKIKNFYIELLDNFFLFCFSNKFCFQYKNKFYKIEDLKISELVNFPDLNEKEIEKIINKLIKKYNFLNGVQKDYFVKFFQKEINKEQKKIIFIRFLFKKIFLLLTYLNF